MTIKPKAQKYRIRRSAPLSAQPNAAENAAPETEEGVINGVVSDAREVATEQSVDDIRKEGLTGRQLRMARRVAQKHGLAPTSDFDAVRLLRAEGIDPFQRANVLELTPSAAQGGTTDKVQLPQTVPTAKSNLPSTQVDTVGARAEAIMAIQRDIAKRRRSKVVLLISRLLFFVLLPTLVIGYYYYAIATPMYATKSQFVIQKADSQGGGGGLGGLLSGTGLSTSQDSVSVQSYLQSREAMLRLDHDHDFKAHFSQSHIDPIQRLDAGATNEAAYRLYTRRVKISYDPTEGVIKMEVVAAAPEISVIYSKALISYAEEQVDHMTSRLRGDQMRGAEDIFSKAESAMLAAQQNVLKLQKESNVLSVEIEVSLLTGQIAQLELLQTTDKLTLVELNSNERPNLAKVKPLERRLKARAVAIADLRAQLTQGSEGAESVADISAKLTIAQINLETRTLMMQQALQQMDTSQVAANRQTRYLSLGVTPIPPDEATYPRKFENTILAFLIFAGAYLMMSLTASILREQVSG
ncbi:capsule biosynthesis protein [Marinosulfonomonas sp. PRT-SC04]|nr:capsule biosynthesis protein [Marinosulfonomonas sp. PRT-SC04]